MIRKGETARKKTLDPPANATEGDWPVRRTQQARQESRWLEKSRDHAIVGRRTPRLMVKLTKEKTVGDALMIKAFRHFFRWFLPTKYKSASHRKEPELQVKLMAVGMAGTNGRFRRLK